MIRTLLFSAALVVGVSAGATAETMTSNGMMMKHHHHMLMKRKHRVSYGVGSGGSPRTTATGGNAGGYSSRN